MNAAVALSDDTNSLVDDALARVRKDACLDAEPVLSLALLRPAPRLRAVPPPLPKPVVRAVVLVPTPVPLPSAEAIVAEVAKKNAQTFTAKRERGVRWPVILCGFVASIFAGAAFMQSPAGQRPAVQHTVKVAKSHGASIYQAAKHATAQIRR